MIDPNRYRALAAVAYLAWAIPFALALSWLIPPWQSPDEPAHMIRADQVAHGQIIGRRIGPLLAGGLSDPRILQSSQSLDALPSHPEQKLHRSMLAEASSFNWGPRSVLLNPNTAQYPPVFYAPPALAVIIGQHCGLSIIRTLHLARANCLLVASLTAACAILVSRRTTGALMVIAMLPMTMALDACVSQDGLIIACTLLAVALLDRLITEQRDASRREAAAIVVLLTLVGTARPPYLPLAFLCLLATRKLGLRAGILTTIPIAGVLAWIVAASLLVTVPMAGADSVAQLNFGAAHPAAIWMALQNTLALSSNELVIETIGKLGWLDTTLDPRFYDVGLTLLLVGIASTLGGHTRRPYLPVAIILSCTLCLVAAQYLTWTKPGSASVAGLQGRYFEVPLAVASLCLPGVPKAAPITRILKVLCVSLMAITVPVFTIEAIVQRFYLN